MKKYIVTIGALVALAAPTAAMASAPDGTWHFKANGASDNASSIGKQSSAINQNGQFVSGQDNAYGTDQTFEPGSRAAIVQAALGH